MSITVTGLICSETDKAILLRVPIDIGVKGHEADVWFPRSQISYLKKEPSTPERLKFRGTIKIPEWLANKNAVIPDDMLPKDYWKKDGPQLASAPGAEPSWGVGMLTTVMATELVEAYAKDEDPTEGGFDISAGLFGTYVSAWLRSVAAVVAQSGSAALLHVFAGLLREAWAFDPYPAAPDGECPDEATRRDQELWQQKYDALDARISAAFEQLNPTKKETE